MLRIGSETHGYERPEESQHDLQVDRWEAAWRGQEESR